MSDISGESEAFNEEWEFETYLDKDKDKDRDHEMGAVVREAKKVIVH